MALDAAFMLSSGDHGRLFYIKRFIYGDHRRNVVLVYGEHRIDVAGCRFTSRCVNSVFKHEIVGADVMLRCWTINQKV